MLEKVQSLLFRLRKLRNSPRYVFFTVIVTLLNKAFLVFTVFFYWGNNKNKNYFVLLILNNCDTAKVKKNVLTLVLELFLANLFIWFHWLSETDLKRIYFSDSVSVSFLFCCKNGFEFGLGFFLGGGNGFGFGFGFLKSPFLAPPP